MRTGRRVARKNLMHAGRSLLRLLERAQRQADQRAADLHDDAGIGQRGLRPAERPTPPSRPTRRLSTSRSSSTGTANDTNAGPQGKWTTEMLVAGVIQNVVRGDLDRLQVRREQLEILGAELRSRSFLGRPVTAFLVGNRRPGTLLFRDGTDGSKVHTRRLSAVEKVASACGIPETAGEAHSTRGARYARHWHSKGLGAAEPCGLQLHELLQQSQASRRPALLRGHAANLVLMPEDHGYFQMRQPLARGATGSYPRPIWRSARRRLWATCLR